jgi:hypothetical protein
VELLEEEDLGNMATDKAKKKALTRVKELEKEIAEAEKKRSGIETLSAAYKTQVGKRTCMALLQKKQKRLNLWFLF